MDKKVKISAIAIILLSIGVWGWQNIPEQTAIPSVSEQTPAATESPSKAISREDARGGPDKDLSANTAATPQTYKALETATAKNTEGATVIAGEKTAELLFAPGTTFYDALVQARNAGAIDFSGKHYPVLGFFVTDIGTLHAGGDLDLLYYINGVEATVGVSAYMLKNGDRIEWKLE